MPWKESSIVDQRLQFLSSYQKEEMSVADLCRAYGISRPTAYRWINRYNETGPEGLVDRSRRPHTCSHATLEPMENAILVLRAKHPSWGARKLKARLEMLQPELVWPAASTFGNILSRAGLTSPQKKRKRITPCSETVFNGHGTQSAVVYGFQRLLRNGRRQAMRSVYHHRCVQSLFDSLPDRLAHRPQPGSSDL